MTTNFRALCAELHAAFNTYAVDQSHHELLQRARAGLAEPEPEGPTDEELEEEFGSVLLKLPGDSMNATAVFFARAVLARWGRPAPQPAALANVSYEWDLEDDEGEWQAGGSANGLDDVRREGMRYLQTYAQEGPHKLIIRQYCRETIDEITNG